MHGRPVATGSRADPQRAREASIPSLPAFGDRCRGDHQVWAAFAGDNQSGDCACRKVPGCREPRGQATPGPPRGTCRACKFAIAKVRSTFHSCERRASKVGSALLLTLHKFLHTKFGSLTTLLTPRSPLVFPQGIPAQLARTCAGVHARGPEKRRDVEAGQLLVMARGGRRGGARRGQSLHSTVTPNVLRPKLADIERRGSRGQSLHAPVTPNVLRPKLAEKTDIGGRGSAAHQRVVKWATRTVPCHVRFRPWKAASSCGEHEPACVAVDRALVCPARSAEQ